MKRPLSTPHHSPASGALPSAKDEIVCDADSTLPSNSAAADQDWIHAFKRLSGAMAVPVAYIDGEGNLISWNEEFSRRFELPECPTSSIDLLSLSSGEDPGRIESCLRQAHGGLRVTFDDKLLLCGERMGGGQITLVPDRDDENRVAGVMLVGSGAAGPRGEVGGGGCAGAVLTAVRTTLPKLSGIDSLVARLDAMIDPIGRAAEASRAYIFRNHNAVDGTILTSQICEWTESGTGSIAELDNIPLESAGFGRWIDLMEKGEAIRGMIREFPETERNALQLHGIRSIFATPLFVGGEWWGFLGFDECSREGTWKKSEQRALQWTSEILSLLIHQYHSENELEENRKALEKAQHATVTGIRESEEELRISARQLRALASRLHTVREEESALISREIHDELGQALTVLKMDVSWVQRRLNRQNVQEINLEMIARLKNMSMDIDETIKAVRRISTQLRPAILDDMGLIGALEWHAGVFEDRTGIRCHITCSKTDLQLDTVKSSAVFRIFQEILTNVARHSGAKRAEVNLFVKDDVLNVRVRDNGRGIADNEQNEAKSLGILGMRERALVCGGNLQIRGEKGRGTEVSFRIPLSG